MLPGKSRRRRAATCSLAVLGLACVVAPTWALSASGRAVGAPAAALALPAQDGNGTYAPGEVIVRFEAGTSAAGRRDARSAANVEFEDTLGLPRAQVVSVEGSVRTAVRRLESQPGVAYAQPNYRYEAQAEPAPDDTFFGELWGLSDPAPPEPGVGVLDAWGSNRGSGEVIAVLDTGVDLTHPDIVGNLRR